MIVIKYRPETELLALVTKPTELTIDPATWADKFKVNKAGD